MALVGAAVVGVTALSLAKVNSISLNAMKANSVALQAYQFADAEAQLVRATDYSDLTSQAKTDILNSNGFQKEVIVSGETNYSDSVKQKTATVKIYKTGETTPRIVLNVKRLSKEVSASSVPSGTILPWYGDLGSIPTGYALCNGSNGTPDLRNRFLVGAGSSYNLGNTGGVNSVTLSKNNLPSDAASGVSGYVITRYSFRTKCYGYQGNWSNSTNGDDTSNVGMDIGSFTSRLFSGWNSAAIENRPPYYAVYYIMKL